jgi:hypothetical protein
MSPSLVVAVSSYSICLLMSIPVTPKFPAIPAHTSLSSMRPGSSSSPQIQPWIKSSQSSVRISSPSQVPATKPSSESGHSTAVDTHSSSPDIDQLEEREFKLEKEARPEPEEEECDEVEDEFISSTLLPEPQINLVTTYDLHKAIHQGQIDLDPEYQRGVVWSDQKQQMLINSLLHNFYVPFVHKAPLAI